MDSYPKEYVVVKIGRRFRIGSENHYKEPRVERFEPGTPLELSVPCGRFERRSFRAMVTEDGRKGRSTRISIDGRPGDFPIWEILPNRSIEGVRVLKVSE